MLGRPVLLALALSLGASSLNAQETVRDRDSLPESSRGPSDRWLAPDKAAHVFAGFWTAGAGYATASALDADASERRATVVTAGLCAGLAKEAFDAFVQHERPSWRDLVADMVGVALLVAVTAVAEP